MLGITTSSIWLEKSEVVMDSQSFVWLGEMGVAR
jgi:hypothetical protein